MFWVILMHHFPNILYKMWNCTHCNMRIPTAETSGFIVWSKSWKKIMLTHSVWWVSPAELVRWPIPLQRWAPAAHIWNMTTSSSGDEFNWGPAARFQLTHIESAYKQDHASLFFHRCPSSKWTMSWYLQLSHGDASMSPYLTCFHDEKRSLPWPCFHGHICGLKYCTWLIAEFNNWLMCTIDGDRLHTSLPNMRVLAEDRCSAPSCRTTAWPFPSIHCEGLCWIAEQENILQHSSHKQDWCLWPRRFDFIQSSLRGIIQHHWAALRFWWKCFSHKLFFISKQPLLSSQSLNPRTTSRVESLSHSPLSVVFVRKTLAKTTQWKTKTFYQKKAAEFACY